MHATRKLTTHHRFRNLTCLEQLLWIDAGVHAHVMKHVDEVFGGQVPRSARRIRTAAQAANGCIEVANAQLEADEHIGQRLAARVASGPLGSTTASS